MKRKIKKNVGVAFLTPALCISIVCNVVQNANYTQALNTQKQTINQLKTDYDNQLVINNQLLNDNEKLTIKLNDVVDENASLKKELGE